jgi:hypothetical protein
MLWKFFILHYIQLYTTSHVVWDESLKAESLLYVSLAAVYWASSVSFCNPSARTTQKTASIVEACLLVRCLAMDVLLLHAYASRECVTESLPSNGYTRQNINTSNRPVEMNGKLLGQKILFVIPEKYIPTYFPVHYSHPMIRRYIVWVDSIVK